MFIFSDVDECLDDVLHTCHGPNMECVNTIGSFECVCEDGFSLNDTNQCEGENKQQSYIPVVQSWNELRQFWRESKFTEVDNCAMYNGGCHSDATCQQTKPGHHECTCKEGFYGNGLTCEGTVCRLLFISSPTPFYFLLIVSECEGECTECPGREHFNGSACEPTNECEEPPQSTFAHKCVNAVCLDTKNFYR